MSTDKFGTTLLCLECSPSEVRDPQCGRLPHNDTSALLDWRKIQKYLNRQRFPSFQAAEGEETTLERTQNHVMFPARVQEKPLQSINVNCSIPCRCNQLGNQNRRNLDRFRTPVSLMGRACTASDNLNSCKTLNWKTVVSRVQENECVTFTMNGTLTIGNVCLRPLALGFTVLHSSLHSGPRTLRTPSVNLAFFF